jgi:hypothetical protein
VAGEYDNEPSGFIKGKEFLDWLMLVLTFQEPCSMDRGSYYLPEVVEFLHYGHGHFL